MREKIICFALCFMLAFKPLPAYALDPVSTTISVVGGTMGTEGLAAIGATGPVALAAVGVTVAVMAGLKIDSNISQASANAGMTKSAYVQKKISDYCTATGKTIGDFSKAILTTVKISRDGLIYMGRDAIDAFTGLFDWMNGNGDLVMSDSLVSSELINGTLATNNFSYNDASDGQVWRDLLSITCAVVAVKRYRTGGGYYIYYYNTEPFTINRYLGDTLLYPNLRSSNYSSANTLGITYRYNVQGGYITYLPEGVYYVDPETYSGTTSDENFYSYLDSLNGQFRTESVDADRDAITTEVPWEQVKADIQPDDNEAVVVDPHAIGAIADSYPAVGDLTISLGDYLDALRKAWDGTIADTIPAVDTLTGEEIAIPIPQDLVDSIPADTTVDIVDEDTIDDTTTVPAIDDTIPPDPADALQGMSVGLDDIFPFCIPFDIYHILQKFNADPVTPVIDLQFPSTIVGTSIPLHIDLNQFDGVAAVARTMELVAYVVGLAIITRKTILRG